MTGGIVVAALLGLAAVAFVLAPLLRRDALDAGERNEPALDELRELHARQQMLLASLKDLEDDRATDKIGDEDYERIKARLSSQAIEVMRRLDAAEAQHDAKLEQEEEASRPLRYPGARRPGESR